MQKIKHYHFKHFTKHLVIYWVLPLFSFGKKANTICSYCNLVIKKKHFNEELTLSFQNNKVNAKIPFWNSTGLILFILLFLPVVISLVSIMINELMNK